MVAFDAVTQRARRILIVASGKSATDLDLKLIRKAMDVGVYVLTVNRAWDWCQYLDGWFTLDPDRYVRKYLAVKHQGIDKFIAVPDDYGTPGARISYHRDVKRTPGALYLRRIPGDGPLHSKYGLSSNPSEIHTGNSAWGALGVARHMQPERVALIGVDADRNTGYANMPGRPRTLLSHLPELFASALLDLDVNRIKVINGSKFSKVDCFERCAPNKAVKWLMEGL